MTGPAPDRAFLGVESSLTGRRWIGPTGEEDRLSEAMAQITRLPLPLCRTLVRRGVVPEDAERFLAPQLRDLLPDPLTLRDMGIAADRLLQAVQSRQRIAVFGDYDVDGGASSALLILWLRALGLQATLYIPDRIDEGYGPNVPAMAALARDHDLILCVDCGTLSHEPIAAAKGADVVVLDHHLGAETLPAALAVVNPNRQDEDGSLGHLCAASVVFLLLVEANRRLRAGGVQGPDLMGMLDLVALATVADVAPLIGVNRALVRQGLKVMARRERPGLVALADVARMDQAPNCYALGFLLGPRVNAGGRIGRADLGARLLATDDAQEAISIAARLDELNTERREIELRVREAALAQAEARGLDGPLVWAAGEGWHPGVVGIVAARLKEATNRPAVVIGLEGGIGKGSGRSVSGVDLGAAVQLLAAEGLLTRGGGPAAGRAADDRGRHRTAGGPDRGGRPLWRIGPCPALCLCRSGGYRPACRRNPSAAEPVRRDGATAGGHRLWRFRHGAGAGAVAARRAAVPSGRTAGNQPLERPQQGATAPGRRRKSLTGNDLHEAARIVLRLYPASPKHRARQTVARSSIG